MYFLIVVIVKLNPINRNMFFHFDKKFKLLAPGRCGSTSLHHYFGYTERALTGNRLPWREFNKGKKPHIIVLRHPVERFWSASNQQGHSYGDRLWYEHCQPYLHNIKCDFKYIPFEKLNSYLELSSDTEITNTSRRGLAQFQKNEFLTKDALVREVSLYNKILKTKQELSIQEWQLLTRK